MSFPFRDVRAVLPNYPGRPLWYQRKEYEIKELIVHHAASGEDASPEDINRIHWERNFGTPEAPAFAPRITYHYLVGAQGQQWKCNATTDVTWHCPGHNRIGLSVAMIGDRNTREIPWDQYQSLIELVRTILERLPITVLKVFCHRTFYPTACPGRYFDLARFQGDLAANIGRAPA